MMKATIEFNLDDFEDAMAHLRATKSSDLAQVLWELVHNTKKDVEHRLQETLDKKSKLNQEGISFGYYEALDHVFERINDLLDSHGIFIDELTH